MDEPSTIRSKPGATYDSDLSNKIPLKILVVDNNPINRYIFQGRLVRLGYSESTILLAVDGREAIEQYQQSLTTPVTPIDAIFIDLRIPDMDGYQLIQELHRMGQMHGVEPSIFALTAYALAADVTSFEDAGIAGFLCRPFKIIDIQNLIVKHFAKLTSIKL